jgi:hypothetical protein
MARAGSFRILIDTALIESVSDAAGHSGDLVDLSRALGGEPASVIVTCSDDARAGVLGVDAAHGLVDLTEDDFAPLPSLVAAAAGEDIDRVTRAPIDGAHAFRLRLSRSI